MSIDDIIGEILKREGWFVDHPADRGGPTKYGITIGTLANWREAPVTVDDVKALGELEARAIYHARYIVQPHFDLLPEPLRFVVVDWGVLSGPAVATRGLQRALGLDDDGILGPKTLEATRSLAGVRAAMLVCAEQAKQIGRLVSNDRSQAAFVSGWLNRLADKMVFALREDAS